MYRLGLQSVHYERMVPAVGVVWQVGLLTNFGMVHSKICYHLFIFLTSINPELLPKTRSKGVARRLFDQSDEVLKAHLGKVGYNQIGLG